MKAGIDYIGIVVAVLIINDKKEVLLLKRNEKYIRDGNKHTYIFRFF